jgi:hypothetical protein
MKMPFAAVLFLSAIVQGAVVAGECVWKGAGWARFDKKENWQGGKVPSAEDMIKPASMLLDLGGGKAVVAGMKSSGCIRKEFRSEFSKLDWLLFCSI